MVATVHEKTTLILNSSSGQKYDNGSAFRTTFEQPLSLPKEAHNCLLSVLESDIFNVVPNLGTASTLTITGLSGSDVTVSFPVGIYNLTDINDRINRQMQLDGYDSDLYRMDADTTTGKVIHVINDVASGGQALTVQWSTATAALQTLIGQTTDVTAPSTAYYFEEGDNIATFNATRYLLIHSDMVSEGIPINGDYFQIIAKHQIIAAPGGQSVYEPEHLSYINVDQLRGNGKSQFRVWLTDQDNNPIVMTEDWSLNIQIEYDMPVIVKS